MSRYFSLFIKRICFLRKRSLQSFTAIGFGRAPTQDYVVRFRDPTYKYAYDLLKANKGLIVTQTSTWIDLQITNGTAPFAGYNYSGSNRVNGERDIGLVIDAVASDILTGGNSFSVAAGLSYQDLATGIYAISSASVTYAKGLSQTALTSLAGKSTLAGTYFNIIISAITDPASPPTRTATTATYVPTTGLLTITSNAHGLSNGTAVKLVQNSLTFTCASDSYTTPFSYPRLTDPANGQNLSISNATTNTFTATLAIT